LFTPKQIHGLLDLLNKQNLIFISSKLGYDYLTEDEVQILLKNGINPYNLYKETDDIAKMSFHFGLLSDAIGEFDSKKINYDDLVEYFNKGHHIPLTTVERNTIDSIKRQYLGDIKAHNGRVFQDVNNIIGQNEKNNRLAYESVIRNEVEKGLLEKKTSEQIARDLANKTGDWSRNFKRIIDYISHQAWDEGRAAMIEDKYGKDALVFKKVYIGACGFCVKSYLTNGMGSEPIIFKLSKLKANGTNIGMKSNELKPVIGPHHLNCRCTLHFYNPNFNWDIKSQGFNLPKNDIKTIKLNSNRKPIRILVKNKEYIV
jgi:hypothetical protein